MKINSIVGKFVGVAVMGSMLAACAQNGMGGYQSGQNGINKQMVGTLAGAAGGAILGSNVGKGKGNIVGIAAGTLLGAALGSTIGESLDRADLNYYNQASQQALETGQPGQALPWSNPQSGVRGTVTPMNYYEQNGTYCREYSQNITVGGRTQEGYGVACRQPDGSWALQN